MNLLEIKEQKILLKCIAIASIVVISYKIEQPILMLIMTFVIGITMFFNDMDEVVATLFFMLPFSAILKFTNDTQSFFRLLEFIFMFLFLYRVRKIDFKSFCVTLLFISYCIGVSICVDELRFFRIINLFIWLIIMIFIFSTVNYKSFKIIGKHFIYGVILSCFIGYFSADIGSLSSFLGEAKIYNAETLELTSRFTGLWNDPNTFSSFICISLYINFILYIRKWHSALIFSGNSILLTLFGLLSLSKMCIIILALTWIAIIFVSGGISLKKKIGIFLAFILSVILLVNIFPDTFEAAIYRFSIDAVNEYDLDSLTTNRYSIWIEYIKDVAFGFNWLLGHGITAILPIGRAAHNTYLQIIYHLGLVGFSIFVYLIVCIAKIPFISRNKLKLSKNTFDYLSVLIVLTVAFFLDYFFIENFYYLFILSVLLVGKGDNLEE